MTPPLPIEEYLPQKRPFILVDRICEADEYACHSEFSIRKEDMMTRGEALCEAGILENMAQTCAAHIGFVEIHIRKSRNIRIGLVAAVKNCDILRKPLVGETIRTTAEVAQTFGDMSVYHIQTHADGGLIAEADIHVVLQENNP